ncbi:hypothetical protein GCM10009087_56390 [Sphingomonas oligophenolica]
MCILKSGPIGLFTGHTWQHWADQSAYLRSAQAFASDDLSPASHWYPLLYAFIAAPFVFVLPNNPFLPVDLICVGIMAQSVARVAGHLGVKPGTALLILLATVLWPSELWHSWVQPWTTTLSAALIWWLMAKTGDIAVGRMPIRMRDASAMGLGAAMIPLTRPTDAVVVLFLGGYSAFALARHRLLEWRLVLAAGLGATLILGVYALLHLSIYGPNNTDYVRMSADVGFSFATLGWKASVLFIDPEPWFPSGRALLSRMPWVFLGLCGSLFTLATRDDAAQRGYAACLLSAAAAYTLILVAYIDLLPSGLWQYGNIHYFKWILPLLGIMAWILIRDAKSRPRIATATVLAMIAATGFRVMPVPARTDEAARRIDFAIPRRLDWARVYFARSVIAEDGRLQRNIFDYHQLPDGRIVHAIALRNDFGAHARWYGGSVRQVRWLAAGLGTTPLAGQWPLTPIARWKTQLIWAPPCWIFGCGPK